MLLRVSRVTAINFIGFYAQVSILCKRPAESDSASQPIGVVCRHLITILRANNINPRGLSLFLSPSPRTGAVRIAVVCLIATLSACGASQDLDPSDGINDPFETQNRKVHAFNRDLDRALVRPAAKGYTNILPDGVEDSIGNFAANLGEPADMTNSLLQGNFRGLGNASLRFAINSTAGVFGLFDVATAAGIPEHDTNFGETLHVWGSGEGSYLELPVLGPSTQRDTVGKFVDLFTNPLSYMIDDPASYIPPTASAAARLGDRGRFADTVDSILYDSADSYSQARLIYLQNRRFALGQDDPTAEIDPFELDTEGF